MTSGSGFVWRGPVTAIGLWESDWPHETCPACHGRHIRLTRTDVADVLGRVCACGARVPPDVAPYGQLGDTVGLVPVLVLRR